MKDNSPGQFEFWRRVEDVFHAALEYPPDERSSFLDRECDGDVAIRGKIERLLARDENTSALLDEPAWGSGISTPSPERMALDEAMSDQLVGPYRLQRLLGAGGMGAVWLAERADAQYDQQVAIKLIKRGMDTDEILDRFRNERQVLANLEHPNIARLYDGGATDDGRPYLVMEYIDGVPIDRYCDEGALTIGSRLELFQAVCGAVQFAHRNLIVHRDLKPRNILVTGNGTVKLLDFGIAKVIDPQPGNIAQPTVTQRQLMTPRYASPEQVMGEPVTTASDVYSLGVILYELLTGQPPYEIETSTPTQYQRVITEEQPPRPSTQVQRIDRTRSPDLTLESISAARGVDPKQLHRQLTGDLDTIILMALRKEPERRYASVPQLSEDIGRHLEELPVVARPDTIWYRTTKFMRRNKVLVASAAVVALIVIGWLVTSTYLFFDATEARKAEAARADEANKARLAATNAQTDAEWQSYIANIAAAESAIRANHVADARRRLNLAPQHLRNWEWWHLYHRIDRSQLALIDPLGGGFTGIAYDPNTQTLVASCAGRITIWHSQSGALIKQIPAPGISGSETLAISPDGRRAAWFAPGINPQLVHVIDLTMGTTIHELPDHRRRIESVEWSSNGRWIAAGAINGLTILWDAETGDVVEQFQSPGNQGQSDRAVALAFSPDSTRLAIGGWKRNIRIWSCETGEQVAVLAGHRGLVLSVAFSPDGSRVVSGSRDRTIRLWDSESGEELERFYGHEGSVQAIAFSPSGEQIVSGSEDQTVRRWDVDSGQQLAVLRGHSASVRDVLVTSDGFIASASLDASVRIWGIDDEDVPTVLQTWTYETAISRDNRLLAIGSMVSRVLVHDFASADPERQIALEHTLALDLSSDGGLLASAALDRRIRFIRTDTWSVVRTIEPVHRGHIVTLRFSPDGRRLVSASYDGAAIVWDIETGEALLTLKGNGSFGDAAFSPDGELIATCGWDRTVRLWNAQTGELLDTLLGHQDAVRALVFSPDGSLLASASEDTTVKLWDVSTRRLLRTLTGHGLEVWAVAFSPDGSRLASGGLDFAIKLWDVKTAIERADLPAEVATLHGHNEQVEHLTFSPDGEYLVSSAHDGVRLWRAASTAQRRIEELFDVNPTSLTSSSSR